MTFTGPGVVCSDVVGGTVVGGGGGTRVEETIESSIINPYIP